MVVVFHIGELGGICRFLCNGVTIHRQTLLFVQVHGADEHVGI